MEENSYTSRKIQTKMEFSSGASPELEKLIKNTGLFTILKKKLIPQKWMQNNMHHRFEMGIGMLWLAEMVGGVEVLCAD